MIRISSISFLIVLSLFTWSCSESENDKTAKIQVSLVDAPADYEAVYVDIQDVQVNSDQDSTVGGGWVSLSNAAPGVYDLLKLTNGEEAFLGEVELPEGNLGQVRLILGDSNILVAGGESYDLTVPSGSQSGLKLNVNTPIEAGVTYKLVLDFDAGKSVVSAGHSGKFNLKPVIRARMEAQTGAISGIVAPSGVQAAIYAIQGTDTASTYPDETGEFLIHALEAGTYDVVAVPSDTSGYQEASISGVEVQVGAVTAIDSLILTQ